MSNKLFLIGIDLYKKKPLNSCVKDICDFKDVLLDKYDFSIDDVYEIINDNATCKNINDALRSYIKILDENDNLIIYYSGHGFFDEITELGYWVPVDGNQGVSSYFSNQMLISLIDKIKAKHIFLISDCCFSASLLTTVPTKSISEYENIASRWALVSSFEKAMDGAESENSLFAETIIDFLKFQSADFSVSDLIEYVKKEYKENISQTPQGYPITTRSHKGGEFFFKIKNEIDDRKFRGYNNFLKILQLYKRTSTFEEEDKVEDKTNKVGFQILKEYDAVQKKRMYYLYLYEGTNVVQTYKKYKERRKIENDKLIIFLPKEKDQVYFERRKKNVNSKFLPLNIFYVDEFIRTQCTPKLSENDESNFLNISNFVLPSFSSTVISEDLNSYIKSWFSEESNPIIVIKGTGGVGKTTFAQYIADKLSSENSNITTFFIDSAQIKDNLLKNISNSQDISIYDFYVALCELNSQEKISKELFQINIDAGNILLVIDGLDEVISKVPEFNTSLFLKSIYDASQNIGGGKVIITCRTYFWENSGAYDNRFNPIELLPFNEEQTEQFFEKSSLDENKKKKALEIAKKFTFEGDKNNTFHPYVLDIIRSIVHDQDYIEIDLTDVSSKILKNKIKNDYIIFRICDRERKRMGQICVDDQVDFFIYMASQRRGSIGKEKFGDELKNALSKHVDDVNVKAFIAHPFLYARNHNVIFRYDFFTDYFRGIFLSSFFKLDNANDNPKALLVFCDLVKECCWFGSTMILDIVTRVDSWDEDSLLYASDLIERIVKMEQLSVKDKRIIVSNYFFICLALNNRFKDNSIYSNTDLLKSLFEIKGVIKNLSIINLNSPVKFDFADLQFENCYFDNFSSFWRCKFSDKTIFKNCYLLNIHYRKNDNIIPFQNFHDCTKDQYIDNAFKFNSEVGICKSERAKHFLDLFFHLFFSNGKLGRQWEDKVIGPRFSNVDKYTYGYKKTIEILKDCEVVLVKRELNKNKLEINAKYREDISKFVKDGTISFIMGKLISCFSQL